MNKSRSKIFLVVLTIVLLASCVPVTLPRPSEPAQGTPTGTIASGGVLVRAMTSEPGRIDPQGVPSSGLSLVLPYLFDTLVVRDVDNTIVPLLAKSWQTSEDGKAITMTLKSGITFHDGAPLNAEAVRFTFERFNQVGKRSPIYGGIRQITGVEAVDDLTVRFTFDQPAANFWSTISMPYAAIISPESARKVDETGKGHVIGSGPFMLGEWKTGQSITLKRNPDYAWGPPIVENQGAPYLDALVYKIIPDPTTQLAALETGEVDVVFINQPSHRLKLEGNQDVHLEEAVLNSLIYLGFNCQKPPFDEIPVRQALAHAVNKDEIVKVALGGMGHAAFAPLPPTLPGFDPSLKAYELGYDLEQAKALLAQAGFQQTANGGWERDGEPLTAQLLTSTRAPNGDIATLLQSQLGALGVPVEIQQLDGKAVMNATTKGQFDLLLWRYDWNDPDALNIFLGSDRIGRTNRVAYSNSQVDELLVKGAHELNEAARLKLYVEAQQVILQDAPWQPLYNPLDVVAISKRIEGTKIGYMGRLLVNDAHVVGE